MFSALMQDVNTRLELYNFWQVLIAQDYHPSDTYTDMLRALSHDQDSPGGGGHGGDRPLDNSDAPDDVFEASLF